MKSEKLVRKCHLNSLFTSAISADSIIINSGKLDALFIAIGPGQQARRKKNYIRNSKFDVRATVEVSNLFPYAERCVAPETGKAEPAIENFEAHLQ